MAQLNNQMNHKQILSKILKPHLLEHNFNIDTSKEEQYSAVSIVLRNMADGEKGHSLDNLKILLNTQILLLQRIENNRMYSGQICFPGGKREQGQSIIETAIRQTEQQSSLKLGTKDLIGIINHRFIAFRRITHTLYTYAVVFYQTQYQQIRLNTQEMAAYRWLPLKYFMKEQVYQPIIIPFQAFSYLMNQFQHFQDIKHFEWPAINVGMKKNLYGLTLYIIGFFIAKLNNSLEKVIEKLMVKINREQFGKPQKKDLMMCLTNELRQVQKYSVKIRDLYFEGLRIVWKQNSKLDEDQKSIMTTSFLQKMAVIFPQRPQF